MRETRVPMLLCVAVAGLGLATCDSRKQQTPVATAQPVAEARLWPFGEVRAAMYDMQISNGDGLEDAMALDRSREVTKEENGVATVVTRQSGDTLREDYYLRDGDVVKWAGFEDMVHAAPPVKFKTPIPMFSPDFKGGERWTLSDQFAVMIVGWEEVPFSTGKVRACKTRIDFSGNGSGYRKLMWFAPEYGIVFEDTKYYQGENLVRHETATLISVNAGGEPEEGH